MAVVTISVSEIMKMTGLKKEQVMDSLNDIGMPNEEEEDELFVEITPNRPDLFSIEGLARAINSFNGKPATVYSAKKSDYAAKIDASVGKSRPYFVSAVVKNVRMDESLLKSLIQLQEKLHDTVGRKRKKVAIGIHNLDAVEFPIAYRFVKDEKFVPLDFDVEMNVKQILEKHPKGAAYAHLVGAGGTYPMLYDKKGVLSFPPIINGERTRVTEETKNLLIDITGTHIGTLSGVLNIIVCALADRGGEVYEVKVDKETYPKLAPVKMGVGFEAINKLIGEKFEKKQVLDYLTRLGWQHDGKGTAGVPPYRMDVSHYADMAEDVAIGHGYNEFAPSVPDFFTPASLRYAYEDLRQAMIGMGFIEVVNYSLTNEKRTGGASALKIINPKTEEFTLLRTSLLGSLLDNVALNKTHELPVKIFEIGRAYEKGEKVHLAFAISSESLDFSAIRSALQSVSKAWEREFVLKKAQNRNFTASRCAEIYLNDKKVGVIGEIAPEILEESGIENPTTVCEIDLGKV